MVGAPGHRSPGTLGPVGQVYRGTRYARNKGLAAHQNFFVLENSNCNSGELVQLLVRINDNPTRLGIDLD